MFYLLEKDKLNFHNFKIFIKSLSDKEKDNLNNISKKEKLS